MVSSSTSPPTPLLEGEGRKKGAGDRSPAPAMLCPTWPDRIKKIRLNIRHYGKEIIEAFNQRNQIIALIHFASICHKTASVPRCAINGSPLPGYTARPSFHQVSCRGNSSEGIKTSLCICGKAKFYTQGVKLRNNLNNIKPTIAILDYNGIIGKPLALAQFNNGVSVLSGKSIYELTTRILSTYFQPAKALLKDIFTHIRAIKTNLVCEFFHQNIIRFTHFALPLVGLAGVVLYHGTFRFVNHSLGVSSG